MLGNTLSLNVIFGSHFILQYQMPSWLSTFTILLIFYFQISLQLVSIIEVTGFECFTIMLYITERWVLSNWHIFKATYKPIILISWEVKIWSVQQWLMNGCLIGQVSKKQRCWCWIVQILMRITCMSHRFIIH